MYAFGNKEAQRFWVSGAYIGQLTILDIGLWPLRHQDNTWAT